MSPKRMGYLKGWHHLVVEIELDCSLPGFSVHGISQARRLEWITISSSRESSPSRDRTHILCLLLWQAYSLPLVPPGTPWNRTSVSKVWRLEDNIGKLKKKKFFLLVYFQLLIINICVCAVLSRVQLYATLWAVACKALLSTGFSRQNTGVSCHSLLQGIFPTQGSNQGLLHRRQTLDQSHWRSHKCLDTSNSGPACFLFFSTYDNNIPFYWTLESLKSFRIILFSLQSILPVQ